MSNEAIEEDYYRMADQIGDEPCRCCRGGDGDGCFNCEYSGYEYIRQLGSSPFPDDDDG